MNTRASAFQHSQELIDRFETDPSLDPERVDQLVEELLRTCGFDVARRAIVGREEERSELDMTFRMGVGTYSEIVGVEVKARDTPVTPEVVGVAERLRKAAGLNRVMLVSRSGFDENTAQVAGALPPGTIDLLSPRELRSWVNWTAFSDELRRQNVVELVRTATAALARRLAENPEQLADVHWRQLEEVLGEVFQGLGFLVTLTRSGKDGGFDLRLERPPHVRPPAIYIVEVKHWLTGRPGSKQLRKVVEVTAREGAAAGVLLSSSGFTSTVFSGITTAELQTVRLGGESKIAALCKTYIRLGGAIWMADAASLDQVLLSGTFNDTEPLAPSP